MAVETAAWSNPMYLFKTLPPFLALLLCLAALGCGDDDSNDNDNDTGDGAGAESGDGDGIEIAGEWKSEWADETISDEMWGEAMIVDFDNADNYAITQNADDADYMPGAFNRNVWTDLKDGAFYYCTVAYDLASAEEAQSSTESADDSDPETDGCGGFPWTKLDPR